jgi:hypothetical protein
MDSSQYLAIVEAEYHKHKAAAEARIQAILAAKDDGSLLALIREHHDRCATTLPAAETRRRVHAYLHHDSGVEAAASLDLNPKVYRKWVITYDLPWKPGKRGRPQLAGPDRHAIHALKASDAEKAERAGMTLDGWRTWVKRHGATDPAH